MREILFRGKPAFPIDKDVLPGWNKWVRDGWIYGYLIGEDVIVGEIVDFEDDYYSTEFWCKVDPDTVGQFSGMLDSKRSGMQEIYEGDILDIVCNSYEDCEATYRGEVVMGGMIGTGLIYKDENGKEKSQPLWDLTGSYTTDYYVIGNIYDNPDLLRE